jgi:hypothetical protein
MTVNAMNELRLMTIDHYIEFIIDRWNFKIDHEDGSTAPFSSVVLEEVECLLNLT